MAESIAKNSTEEYEILTESTDSLDSMDDFLKDFVVVTKKTRTKDKESYPVSRSSSMEDLLEYTFEDGEAASCCSSRSSSIKDLSENGFVVVTKKATTMEKESKSSSMENLLEYTFEDGEATDCCSSRSSSIEDLPENGVEDVELFAKSFSSTEESLNSIDCCVKESLFSPQKATSIEAEGDPVRSRSSIDLAENTVEDVGKALNTMEKSEIFKENTESLDGLDYFLKDNKNGTTMAAEGYSVSSSSSKKDYSEYTDEDDESSSHCSSRSTSSNDLPENTIANVEIYGKAFNSVEEYQMLTESTESLDSIDHILKDVVVMFNTATTMARENYPFSSSSSSTNDISEYKVDDGMEESKLLMDSTESLDSTDGFFKNFNFMSNESSTTETESYSVSRNSSRNDLAENTVEEVGVSKKHFNSVLRSHMLRKSTESLDSNDGFSKNFDFMSNESSTTETESYPAIRNSSTESLDSTDGYFRNYELMSNESSTTETESSSDSTESLGSTEDVFLINVAFTPNSTTAMETKLYISTSRRQEAHPPEYAVEDDEDFLELCSFILSNFEFYLLSLVIVILVFIATIICSSFIRKYFEKDL